MQTTNEDREAVRAERQARNDAKAARYEGWAAKRRAAAGAAIASENRDWAWMSQPGHLPGRAREIAKHERALGSLAVADKMEAKAERLRASVAVAGDAEIARQAKREAVAPKLTVGARVFTHLYGFGSVEKINRKTARVLFDGRNGPHSTTVDLSWIEAAS